MSPTCNHRRYRTRNRGLANACCARAKRLHSLTQNGAFLQGVAQLRPDLIVIAYGTNEVTDDDWTIASYERMLVDMIRRLHSAAPGASVLIIGPPDRAVQGSDGWISARKMSALLEAQRRAAFSADAALWSSYDAMGGAGSMNAWVARGLGRSDHVHLTPIGYNKLGRMFYGDLISVYRSRLLEPSRALLIHSPSLWMAEGFLGIHPPPRSG